LAGEIHEVFENYVDLTSEFIEPLPIRCGASYCSFPILDGMAPSPKSLHDVILDLRPGRTFVHCAQGHGRTGLFAAALLISRGQASSVEEGLMLLTEARPSLRLNQTQLACLQKYVDEFGGNERAEAQCGKESK
jgi:protein-tyrosine phosphatase